MDCGSSDDGFVDAPPDTDSESSGSEGSPTSQPEITEDWVHTYVAKTLENKRTELERAVDDNVHLRFTVDGREGECLCLPVATTIDQAGVVLHALTRSSKKYTLQVGLYEQDPAAWTTGTLGGMIPQDQRERTVALIATKSTTVTFADDVTVTGPVCPPKIVIFAPPVTYRDIHEVPGRPAEYWKSDQGTPREQHWHDLLDLHLRRELHEVMAAFPDITDAKLTTTEYKLKEVAEIALKEFLWLENSEIRYADHWLQSVPGEEGHGSDTRSPARRFSRPPTLLPCAPLPRHPPPPASLPLAEPHPSKPARAVQRALERPSSASRAPPSASPATLQHARRVCVCVCVCCAPRWSCPSCPPLLPRS